MTEDILPPSPADLLKYFQDNLIRPGNVVADMASPLYGVLADMAQSGATVEAMHKKIVEILIRLAHFTAMADPRRSKLLEQLEYIDQMGSELEADESYQDILQELWDLNLTMSRLDYATLAVAVGDPDDLWYCLEQAKTLIDAYEEDLSP